jgi:hypothetical protein
MGRLTLLRRRLGAAAMAGAVAIGTGCRQKDASVAASGPYADVVAKYVPKIEKATGMKFVTPPKLETRTRDEVHAFLEQRFREEMPGDELDGMARAYKRFGLLPDTLDLGKFMLDLLTEQVAGYYDPRAKVLYVVEGSDPQMIDITISHELVHALQDQHFNLDSLQQQHDDNDRATAAQAVVEGQATLEQIGSMIGSDNIAARLPGGWDRVRQLIRENQGSMPKFAAAPLLLQETLLFPYLSGAEFMRNFKDEYPGQSPFDHMPVSTEQVMRPDKYAPDPDPPTVVGLPAPLVGKPVYQNDLGEFETRLLLYEWLRDQASAVRGAAGWDGDRYQLVSTSRGDGIAWVTVWDTKIDAAEFFDLLDIGLLKRFPTLTPSSADETTRTYRTDQRAIVIAVADIEGRPAVTYTDVPQGVSTRVLDLGKVTLKE